MSNAAVATTYHNVKVTTEEQETLSLINEIQQMHRRMNGYQANLKAAKDEERRMERVIQDYREGLNKLLERLDALLNPTQDKEGMS